MGSIQTLKIDLRRAKELGINVPKRKRNKYNAKRVTLPAQSLPGITLPEAKFDSIHESNLYLVLCDRWRKAEIKYFIRQVPIVLPGGQKMRIDFMIAYHDNTIEWIDAKGHVTKDWEAKRRVVEECYGLKIQTW